MDEEEEEEEEEEEAKGEKDDVLLGVEKLGENDNLGAEELIFFYCFNIYNVY